jgi:4-hydroxy-tetrahydrodipicolinate reductase
MKIALFGYGKMGREVEAAANDMGHEIVGRFDIDNPVSFDALKKSGATVAIDFSLASAVEANVELAANASIPIVIGTTGWDSKTDNIRAIVEKAGIGCVIGSNFSVGVNLFLQIVCNASKLVNSAGYDAYISEAHHRGKKDFPSGTALRVAEAVLSGLKSKTNITPALKQGEAIAADTLLISSIRAGEITGTHTVGFDGEDDSIELTHRAKGRRGFARGAVQAAEWIIGRKGFYRFEENISEISASANKALI